MTDIDEGSSRADQRQRSKLPTALHTKRPTSEWPFASHANRR